VQFSHTSPDCAKIPDESVLQTFLDRIGWIHAADGVDLRLFWEHLLEKHGYESDRQQARKKWIEICTGAVQKALEQDQNPDPYLEWWSRQKVRD